MNINTLYTVHLRLTFEDCKMSELLHKFDPNIAGVCYTQDYNVDFGPGEFVDLTRAKALATKVLNEFENGELTRYSILSADVISITKRHE